MYLHKEGTCHVSDDFVPRLALWDSLHLGIMAMGIQARTANKVREVRLSFGPKDMSRRRPADNARQCQTSRQADKQCRQGPVGQAPAR